MKVKKLIFLILLISIGFYINLQREKTSIFVIQASDPLSLTTVADIIKTRSQIFYGYVPKIQLDVAKSQILVTMQNDISPLLQKGEFLAIQNSKEVLNNSDIIGSNFLGPVTINKTSEFEIFIFLKNNSLQKISLNSPLYIFVDRPKNTIVVFDLSKLGVFSQDKILALQSATSLINNSIPIFFYANESQLYSLLDQIKKFKSSTLIYYSQLPKEFIQQLQSLNITLKNSSTLPEFIGSSLISWKAIGLQRVINNPAIELEPFLNKSVIAYFEIYPQQKAIEEINKTKLLTSLLSTLPLQDVKLISINQKSFDKFEFIVYYFAFILLCSSLAILKKQKIEEVIEALVLAFSLILILGFDKVIYLALLSSLLFPKNSFSIALLAFCLVFSSLFSSFLSAFFLASFSFVFLSFFGAKL